MQGTGWKLIAALAVTVAGPVGAQTADEARGGWVADLDGTRHIYMLKIDDNNDVSGLYCHDCAHGDNIAFVTEGRFEDGEFDFTVLHDRGAGAPYRRTVHAALVDDKLMVTSRRADTGESSSNEFHRQSRLPPPDPDAPPAPPRPEYVMPGPAEPITTDSLTGLWLANAGTRTQYLNLRLVGDEILGLVCGPCDNVNNMGPIENVSFDGTDLYFEVVHEDAGTDDGLNNAPFYNTVDGKISRHELHIGALRNIDPPGTDPFTMVFVGPFEP
jgi:hypothetical protein